MLVAGRAELARTWALLVAVDMIGAFWAVRRFNAKRIPSEGTQRRWALVAVVLAFATTLLTAER